MVSYCLLRGCVCVCLYNGLSGTNKDLAGDDEGESMSWRLWRRTLNRKCNRTVKLARVGQSVSSAGEHPAHWSLWTQTRLHSDHITISARWIRLEYCDWDEDIKRFHIIYWCSFNVRTFLKNAHLCPYIAKCLIKMDYS